MTLLICPVRPGESNEELRFALRSWETNLLLPGGLTLWTVGFKPSWLEPDRHIDGNRYDSMPMAVFDNVREGARAAAAEGFEEAIFMNDDFFCLDPVGSVIAVCRNSTLAEHVLQFPPNAGMWWPRSLRATLSWANENGFHKAMSYEVHRPLICDPRDMAEVLGGIECNDPIPQWRTVYGAKYLPDAVPVQDCKLGLASSGVGTPWVSTSDQSWRRYARDMTVRFRKQSKWELDCGERDPRQ